MELTGNGRKEEQGGRERDRKTNREAETETDSITKEHFSWMWQLQLLRIVQVTQPPEPRWILADL